jgi:hypothetical protein
MIFEEDVVRITPAEAIDICDGSKNLGLHALGRYISDFYRAEVIAHKGRIDRGEVDAQTDFLDVTEPLLEIPVVPDDMIWYMRRSIYEAKRKCEASRQAQIENNLRSYKANHQRAQKPVNKREQSHLTIVR